MSQRFSRAVRETLTPEQCRVFDAIEAGPRRSVPLIFQVLLESAEFADGVQRLGAFLRYSSGLPSQLSEFAILVTARHWRCAYEWAHHEREARTAGVSDTSIAAVADDNCAALQGDEALIYGFTQAVLVAGDVPDTLFDSVTARFGRRVAVTLTGILGYYSMLAMVTRVFRLHSEDQV